MLTIFKQREIVSGIFECILGGEDVPAPLPGQFLHVKVTEGFDPLLRRPISVADANDHELKMIYRREGKGTALLAKKVAGDTIDVLGPLGNGFPLDEVSTGETALLVGGGIGVPPLYYLAKKLVEQGVRVVSILGFASKTVSFYEAEFSGLGAVYVASEDGSFGTKGFVTDVIDLHDITFDVLYACGPIPMLRSLESRYHGRKAFLSLEQRMGCGIGACFACVCHLQNDPDGLSYRKVCSDGPVFSIGEVVL
mgnify:CR=1 FL=1